MKIYIIPAWYPKNENDVTASFFRHQAHALAKRGHDITVIHIEPISFARLFRQTKHEVRLWQDGNVRTFFHKVVVPIPGKLADWQDNYLSNLYCKIIRDHIAEDKESGFPAPDVLHAHVSHSCAYYCLRASKQLKTPLVVTEHYSGLLLGTATEREYRRVHDTIENADAFIFVGSNFQKTLCKKLKTTKETFVIPNMVDTNYFEIKQTKNEKFTFLTACHLKKYKSVDLVICTFYKAFQNIDNVFLNIAGTGEELSELKELVKEFKLENRVSFLGKYSREDSKHLFSQADAFVLTSMVETFGIVYIEALSSGVPCIGTKGQGADDIINESNGFTVKYGDIDELADRMRELYENHAHYDPKTIRKHCVEKFDTNAVCGEIEKMYNNVLKKKNK